MSLVWDSFPVAAEIRLKFQQQLNSTQTMQLPIPERLRLIVAIFGLPLLCYQGIRRMSHLGPVGLATTHRVECISTPMSSILVISRNLSQVDWETCLYSYSRANHNKMSFHMLDNRERICLFAASEVPNLFFLLFGFRSYQYLLPLWLGPKPFS